jgi:hypothetical protein
LVDFVERRRKKRAVHYTNNGTINWFNVDDKVMSVHVGFVVDKVALGQVFLRVLRFSYVNFISPVLHYLEKRKKLTIFITGLHNKAQGCGASVASAAGPFNKKKKENEKSMSFM